MSTAEKIIEAIRANGNDPRDLRDAAHEATHALTCAMKPGTWERECIHRALMKRGRAEAFANEVMARAVEQVVSADLGVDPGTVDEWAFVAFMETLKTGIRIPASFDLAGAVKRRMADKDVRAMADRIIALEVPRV